MKEHPVEKDYWRCMQKNCSKYLTAIYIKLKDKEVEKKNPTCTLCNTEMVKDTINFNTQRHPNWICPMCLHTLEYKENCMSNIREDANCDITPPESLSPQEKIAKAVFSILKAMEEHYGLILDEHFKETPERVARAYEEIFGGLINTEKKVESLLNTTFFSKADEMVVVRDIKIYSMCPHHLLPVEATVSLGYLPDGKVLGLSKLARLVELLGKRPIIQEDLTSDIGHRLYTALGCRGVGVKVCGYHFCMKMRGVKKEAPTITTCMLGMFRDSASTRHEFLDAIR